MRRLIFSPSSLCDFSGFCVSHPPRSARLPFGRNAPPARYFPPVRQRAGVLVRLAPPLFLAHRGAGRRAVRPLSAVHPPTPTLKRYCVFFRVSPFGTLTDALAGSVAPLPLLVRSPLRFRSVASTRSALRLHFIIRGSLARFCGRAMFAGGRSITPLCFCFFFWVFVRSVGRSRPPLAPCAPTLAHQMQIRHNFVGLFRSR